MNDATMPKDFWYWFDDRRKKFDLSDYGVARKAKISHSVISQARRGIQPIGFASLLKIAQALETDPVFALRLSGLLPRETDDEKELTSEDMIWRTLIKGKNANEKQWLIKVVRAIHARAS